MRAALTLLLVVSLVTAERGNLLLQKTIESDHSGIFSPQVSFTVKIDVYNAGDGAAYDVRVDDKWPSDFTIAGSSTAQFQEIAAGGHDSFNFTVTPQTPGEYAGSRAVATYSPALDSEQQTALSTSQGDLRVLDAQLYSKLTAKHTGEWIIFWMLTAGSVVVPFILWLQIQLNYEHGLPRGQKKKQK